MGFLKLWLKQLLEGIAFAAIDSREFWVMIGAIVVGVFLIYRICFCGRWRKKPETSDGRKDGAASNPRV